MQGKAAFAPARRSGATGWLFATTDGGAGVPRRPSHTTPRTSNRKPGLASERSLFAPDDRWAATLVKDAARVAAVVVRFSPNLRGWRDDLEAVALLADVDHLMTEVERLRAMRRACRRFISENLLGQIWSLDVPTHHEGSLHDLCPESASLSARFSTTVDDDED